jgi:hypothetical protein
VINEADLRELSAAQRRQLARSLAFIDYPHPLLEVSLARGRKLGALFSIVACTVLVGWIIVLVFTLHSIASALVVELPIAFLMPAAARRLIRLSALVAVSGSADGELSPSLWRTALVGDRAAEPR